MNYLATLEALGVIAADRLELFFPSVRDRNDIEVLRDRLTEVIVLSKFDHMSVAYYEQKDENAEMIPGRIDGLNVESRRSAESIRRCAQFGKHIRSKRWLDFGCGLGGLLDELGDVASCAAGVEPNLARAKKVSERGHAVFSSIDSIDDCAFDVITLFHVLEHLLDPVETLIKLRRVLAPSGRLIVEVPHARDALITVYDCAAFKRFTFWSEHLVLHTRLSLKAVLDAAGFCAHEIMAYQRYPLANHLHWLAKSSGGGQDRWPFLESAALEAGYAAKLAEIDRTDTLLAFSDCKSG